MNVSLFLFAGQVFRITAIACVVALIGLVAGAACVLLPVGAPFIIVALVAVLLLWLMPDLRTVPTTVSRRMFYVFLFVGLCIPSYYTIIIPGLPWMSIRRLALFAFAIPTVIVLSGSSYCRHHIIKLMKRVPFALICLSTFILIALISTILSVRISDSINGLINIATGWFLPFFALLMLLRSRRDTDVIMRLLAICILFDFVTGFTEFYLRRPFMIYLLPAGLRAQVLAANPLYITLFQGQGIRNGLYRASSAFNISLSWGEMGAMLAPIALHFLVHGTTRRDRILGGIGFPAAFGSIICSGARGAYVSFLAALIAYALIWSIRLLRQRPASLAGSSALVILGTISAIVIFAVLFVGPIRSYVLGSGNTQASNDARWLEWALARPKVLASPIWGYGPGTSATVIGYYPYGSQSPTVDSYVMTGLVEYGVVGFVALTLTLAGTVYLSIRRYVVNSGHASTAGNALACSLIAFMIYRITLSQQENMSTMWIILGLAIFLLSEENSKSGLSNNN